MEDAIVKTVAGFLNTDGGSLLIGVGPDRVTVGLDQDYELVKPRNGDGFVNWLTTHLDRRARPPGGDAHPGTDRAPRRVRGVPRRRGEVLGPGVGEDEQR